jgi:hypothetical protein
MDSERKEPGITTATPLDHSTVRQDYQEGTRQTSRRDRETYQQFYPSSGDGLEPVAELVIALNSLSSKGGVVLFLFLSCSYLQ